MSSSSKKWRTWWMVIIGAGVLYLAIAFLFCRSDEWMSSWLQVGGTALALFSAVLIMRQSSEESDRATQQQINAMQESTEKQIAAIQRESDKTIKEMQASTLRQIEVIQDKAREQMDHLSELTNKQIEANRQESRKQMDTFIAQTEEIVDRLEGVAEHLTELARLSGELVETEKELKDLQERKMRQSEEDLKRKQEEFQESVERTRPHLLMRLEQDTEFIFWKFVYVEIFNHGGDASSLNITLNFRHSYLNKSKRYTFSYGSLQRGKRIKFKSGRVKSLKDYDSIFVECSAWDLSQREYHGRTVLQHIQAEWLHLPTEERRMLNQ